MARARSGEIGRHRRRSRATTGRSGARRSARADRRSRRATRRRRTRRRGRAPRRAAAGAPLPIPRSCPPSHAGRQVTMTGRAPAGERAGDVGIADRVEPQLDEVGVGRPRRARCAQLRHRRRGHGDTEQRWSLVIKPSTWHSQKKSLFNRSAEEARNLVARWQVRPRRLPLRTCSNTTTPTRDTAVRLAVQTSKRVTGHSTNHRSAGRYQTALSRCQTRMPISP